MAFYFEDLQEAVARGCQVPGCTHEEHHTLFVQAKCHPRGWCEVSYTKDSGEILVACSVCHKPIARYAIARREPGQN